MKGGGIDSSDSGMATTAVLLGLAAIMAGGTYFAVKRLNVSFPLLNRDNDRKGQERNDSPPQTHGL
jgi:hypothetical protein